MKNIRVILITVLVIGALLVALFPDEALGLIGQNKDSGFTIGKGGSSDMEFTAQFSVIRFRGEPVSIQPVIGREKVLHFSGISEDQLKAIMGVEEYFNNKSLIKSYRLPAVPMTIPSKGEFTHRLEKCEIIPLE